MIELREEPAGSAFESFHRRERDSALRLAWFLTRDRADAEDVVQVALVKVNERFASLLNPAAYLRVVVLNGCRELARRRRTERAHAAKHATEDVTWMRSDVELLSAVAELPYPLREVLVLRYWLDLPDDEIAVELGVHPTTVRTRTHRALAALRKEIDE